MAGPFVRHRRSCWCFIQQSEGFCTFCIIKPNTSFPAVKEN